MIKKFNIVNAVLMSSLFFFPLQSLTIPIHNHIMTQNFGLYLSTQYKSSIPYFKNFSVQESKPITLVGLKHDVQYIKTHILTNKDNYNVIPYVVKFKNSFISFGGTIGYHSNQGPRVEIECSYQNFDVVNCKHCQAKDVNKYFALARKISNTSPQDQQYTFMKNDGIAIVSVMINGCYDFSFLNNTTKVSPYVCASVGGDFIEFFEAIHVKFAYQSKLGINYPISSSINFFADAYYHKIINDQFKNLHVNYAKDLQEDPKIISAVAALNIGYFGGEIGIRFTL